MSLVTFTTAGVIGRHGYCRKLFFLAPLFLATAPLIAQVTTEPRATGRDEKAAQDLTNAKDTSTTSRGAAPADGRNGKRRLRPFYDVSFHSVPSSSTVNLSDHLVDQNFWSRRPTIVVATPISPNVLQPDEGHAESLTETLLRQIAADLGVR